jgi:hypothetical protein
MPVQITGLEQLFKKLDNAAANQTLTPPMQRGVLRLQAAMQVYPPAPSHSKYVRTGTYGRRWTTRVTGSGSGLIGRVGNNVPYAPWVGSAMFQTRFHAATGWRTDRSAVEQNEAAIVADFAAAVDRALAG